MLLIISTEVSAQGELHERLMRLNMQSAQDACDAGLEALAPKCRAICNQMAPSLAYACSTCEGKVVCTRDNHLPILGAITKRRVRARRAMRTVLRAKARKEAVAKAAHAA